MWRKRGIKHRVPRDSTSSQGRNTPVPRDPPRSPCTCTQPYLSEGCNVLAFQDLSPVCRVALPQGLRELIVRRHHSDYSARLGVDLSSGSDCGGGKSWEEVVSGSPSTGYKLHMMRDARRSELIDPHSSGVAPMSTGAAGSCNGVCVMLCMVFSHSLYGMSAIFRTCRGGSPRLVAIRPMRSSDTPAHSHSSGTVVRKRISAADGSIVKRVGWRHHSDC
jgi:hypothetical protein